MRKIGKYIIKGLLGKGGMGKVYKVSHPVTGKIYALKSLDPNPFLSSILGTAEIKRIFMKEAMTISGIRHPNIIEIFDYDENEGSPFYLMEYYSTSLGDMIGETYVSDSVSRIMPVERALNYMRQILSGLCVLHHKDMVHRDIKPFNLLVTEYDQIKICDFGLSKLRNEIHQAPGHLKIGSPWYASPEQEVSPDSVTFSADTYSCGVVFYRMLTGILPLNEDSDFRLPSEIGSGLDEIWDEFFIRALMHDPAKRYSNAEEMLSDLALLAEHWKKTKEKTCVMPFDETGLGLIYDKRNKCPKEIRGKSLKVGANDCEIIFSVDSLHRPICTYENDFQILDDLVIMDRESGLLWEKSGSFFSLDHIEAENYLNELNERFFCGFSDWRLPTVDELMTILKPVAPGIIYCTTQIFDSKQKRIWSSDRKTFSSAWYVDFDMGYVGFQDLTAFSHVRAVRKNNSINSLH